MDFYKRLTDRLLQNIDQLKLEFDEIEKSLFKEINKAARNEDHHDIHDMKFGNDNLFSIVNKIRTWSEFVDFEKLTKMQRTLERLTNEKNN